ncbi:H-NS family nucleoid-associated regulatory protein [Cupriavidus sp. H19C3]|jgi:DNA-binding protein H-NS|uniref:H-NS histone family protein n=1 Tax=Cupriavidus sp. H19C3 TaxID=3241603 RepID=UPI003BF8224E
MATYKELLDRRAALDAEIDAVRAQEVGAAIDRIRELMAQYELTPDDVVATSRGRKPGVKSVKAKASLPAMYQDPKTGKTWSGRGRVPAWLGKNRERFRIAD